MRTSYPVLRVAQMRSFKCLQSWQLGRAVATKIPLLATLVSCLTDGTSAAQISNLGGVPKELKPGMDATAAQSAGGAPSRFEEVARNTAPPTAKAGGVGHGLPPQQTGVTGTRFAPSHVVI